MASRGARHRDRRGLPARAAAPPSSTARLHGRRERRSARCRPRSAGDLQATHVGALRGLLAAARDPGDEGAAARPRQPVRAHRLHAGRGRGRLPTSPTRPRRSASRWARARPAPARSRSSCACSSSSRRRRRRRSTFPNTVANAPASQVSIELKIFGPNVTITQKDPSALNALLYSALALSSGRARAMLAGAVDEWNFVLRDGLRPRRRAARREARLGDRPGRGRLRRSCSRRRRRARARGARPLARLAGIATAGVASEPYRFAPGPRRRWSARSAARSTTRARAPGDDRPLASLARRRRRDGPRGGRGHARPSSARRCPASSPSRTRSARWPRPAARSSSRRARALAGGQRRARGAPSSTPSARAATSSRPSWRPRRDGLRCAAARAARGPDPRDPRALRRVRSLRRRLARPLRALPRAGPRGADRPFGFTAARALAMGYKVPITRMELKYRAPAPPDQTIRVTARLRAAERRAVRHGLRDPQRRRATCSRPPMTEQVVLNAAGRAPPDAALRPARPVRLDPRVPGFAGECRRDEGRRRPRILVQPALARSSSPASSSLLVVFYFVVASRPVNDAVIVPFTAGDRPRLGGDPVGARRKGLRRGHRDPLRRLRRQHRERLQRRRDGPALRLGRPRLPGALAAAPRRARRSGFAAIQLLNLVRVVSLFWIGAHRPALFSSSHTVLWQSAVVLLRRAPLPLLGVARAAGAAAAAVGAHGPSEEPLSRRPGPGSGSTAAPRRAWPPGSRPASRSGSPSRRPTRRRVAAAAELPASAPSRAPPSRRSRPPGGEIRVDRSDFPAGLAAAGPSGRGPALQLRAARGALRARAPSAGARRASGASGSRRRGLWAIHVLALVFQVESVYATRLGAWSEAHYGRFARNFWAGGLPLLPDRRPLRRAVRAVVGARCGRRSDPRPAAEAGKSLAPVRPCVSPRAGTGSPGSPNSFSFAIRDPREMFRICAPRLWLPSTRRMARSMTSRSTVSTIFFRSSV